MSALRVLYLCHNHPDLHAGGTEIFAHRLFREVKTRPGLQALFVGCTNDIHRARKPGTLFQGIGRSADELLLWAGHFDRFFHSQIDLHAVVPEFGELLRSFRPDVVHFHHSLLAGVELIPLVRRFLPEAKIVFTLHDYYPICANDGQMVTTEGRLCRKASADACHRCFPETEASEFVLRELFLKTHLAAVDRFLAPSRFLMERYVEWGIEKGRIEVLRNGQEPAEPAPHRTLAAGARRDRFGFFGHINRFKGAMLALDAAQRLERDGAEFSLTLHGGDQFQAEAFRDDFRSMLRQTRSARFHGVYARGDIPALMEEIDWVVVPSTWWENAPLVIAEAFQHRRPVICADIGGMAEAVRDGVDGLHFRAGDAAALAATMRRALATEGLWDSLVDAIPGVRTIAEAANDHLALYRRLAGTEPVRLPKRRRAAAAAA